MIAFLVGGMYLGIDAVLLAGGDATNLLQLGVPKSLILLLAALLATAGLAASLLVSSRIGLTPQEGMTPRFVVFGLAFGSYLVAMLIYHVLFSRHEIVMWLAYVGIGLAVLGLWCTTSPMIEARLCSFVEQRYIMPPSSLTAIVVATFGVAVVVAELFFFGSP